MKAAGGVGAPGQAGDPPGKDLALWSLILGVASLVCLGPLAGVPGVVLGIKAKRLLESAGAPSGMATAGIVTGIVGTVTIALAVALQLFC